MAGMDLPSRWTSMVRHQFVEIGGGDILKDGVAAGGVDARDGALQFREEGQGSEGDAEIVHGLW